MSEGDGEDNTVGWKTHTLLRRYRFVVETLLYFGCSGAFVFIPVHVPFRVHQHRGSILHVTRRSWLPFLFNERFPLQIQSNNIFRFTYEQKKRISLNVSTEQPSQSPVLQPTLQNQCIYNWRWWPRSALYIRTDTAYTLLSTFLLDAALLSDHSSSTTHLSVLAPVRICASQRGEKRDTSLWDRFKDRDGAAPSTHTHTPVYMYVAYIHTGIHTGLILRSGEDTITSKKTTIIVTHLIR
jgi:hypothetical protein